MLSFIRRRPALAAAFVLTLACPLTAAAAEPEWLVGLPSARARAQATPADKARTYLIDHAASLGLHAVDLTEDKVVASAGGSTVVRFEQRHGGVKVLNKSAVVRVGRGGDVTRLVLSVARDLTVSTVPTLGRADAEAALAQHLSSPIAAEKAELVVSDLGSGALLWQLDVRDTPGGTRYWVDAHTGELWGERPLAVHALGRVYEMNSVETPTPVDVELLELDLAAVPIHLNGWGGLFSVTNYVSGSSQAFVVEQTVVPSAGEDFLFDPPAMSSDRTDAFAQVNLYHHITSMKSFAADLGVAIDQPSWKLTAVANVLENGMALDNAFFSPMGQPDGPFEAPNLIGIGQGSVNDFAYDSDVFKHEFGHYFTHNAVGYNASQIHFNEFGISPHSGSIDEGIADYLACSDNEDAELGEASLALLGGLRDLTDTSARCPESIIGEVHADGQIAGSIAWSVRVLLGKDLGDELVWGAVTTLPFGATFGDLGRGLISAAQEMEAAGDLTAQQVADVEALVADRGIDECDHVIPIDAGEQKTLNVLGLELLGQLFGQPCSALQAAGFQFQSLFHLSHQPDPQTTMLRLQVDATVLMGSGTPQFKIYMRRNEHVGMSAGGGFSLPVPEDFDAEVAIDGASGEMVLEGADFDPTAEHFFLITNVGCPSISLSVSTSSQPEMPPTTSASSTAASSGAGGSTSGAGGGDPVDPGEEPAGGCDCRDARGGSAGGAGVALGALALAALLRRRRR